MARLTWRGLTADYAPAERQFMRQLAAQHPDEAALIHEMKALLDARAVDDGRAYIYAWGNNPRRAELKGRRCIIEAEGAKNTVLVRFIDNGERVTTSRRALRKVTV